MITAIVFCVNCTQWFNYNGGNTGVSSNYSLHGATAPICPGATQQLCAIHAENDGSDHPDLDINIALEMVEALQSQTNSANVKLKAR